VRAHFSHRLRVRYPETDQQGCVYHSRYLEYFDVAMTEFFRALGWNYPDLVAAGCDPSLVETHVVFKGPARFDDEVDIAVRSLRVGNSSFVLSFALSRPNEAAVLVSGQTTYVNIDAATSRPRPLPPPIRTALSERVEPQES
jgi:acyl-CoA thioester hydrolase